MSIGAGGILGASLLLGLALGATTASAQTPSNGAWTDPPARAAAPAASPPAAASPVAPVTDPASAASNGSAGKAAEGPVPATRADGSSPAVVRHAAVSAPRKRREAKRPRPQVVAAAPRVRAAAPRFVARREAMRPVPRRVVARGFAPQPYPYGPLPVGRVAGSVDGERDPIFAEGDDRMRRIAAAQAAGYLVVRSRAVQFPDGRTVRSYRSYDDDDGLD